MSRKFTKPLLSRWFEGSRPRPASCPTTSRVCLNLEALEERVTPSISFAAAVDYSVGANPCSITTGDFNGDGNLDLAVVNSGSDDVSILTGVGDGTFNAAVNFHRFAQAQRSGAGDDTFNAAVNDRVAPGPVCVTGDFNVDGKLDLAVANFHTNSVSVLLNQTVGPGQPTIPTIGDTATDNTGGSALATAMLTTQAAPTVTLNPVNTQIYAGGFATFTALASDATTVKWQWSRDGGATWGDLSNIIRGGNPFAGVNTNTLEIRGLLTTSNGMMFRAVFSNTSGSTATTGATLTIVSQYANASVTNAYYAYYAAYNAYAATGNDYAYQAYVNAAYAYNWAAYAYQYSAAGNASAASTCAYYAYVYSYASWYYSSYAYAATGNANAYYAWYFGYYSTVYNYYMSIGY